VNGIAPVYGLDEPGFEMREGMGIDHFITASRPAMCPASVLSNVYQVVLRRG